MSGPCVLISGSNDQQGGLTLEKQKQLLYMESQNREKECIDQGHTATQASGDPFTCEDKDEGDGGLMH
jgi:hypothetical protein